MAASLIVACITSSSPITEFNDNHVLTKAMVQHRILADLATMIA